MPRVQIAMTVANDASFRKMSAALREQGNGDLRRRFNKGIRDAAQPVIADLRRAASNIPDRSDARRQDNDSLRRILSAAIRVQITQNGASIIVDTAKMPRGTRGVVFGLESKKGFRHPVFGRNVWVRQPGAPWFRPTLRKHNDRFRRAVESVLADVQRDLDARG